MIQESALYMDMLDEACWLRTRERRNGSGKKLMPATTSGMLMSTRDQGPSFGQRRLGPDAS